MLCKHDLSPDFCDYCKNGNSRVKANDEFSSTFNNYREPKTYGPNSKVFELQFSNKQGCSCGMELRKGDMAAYIANELKCEECFLERTAKE